jgi:hypothetical protein
MGIMVCSVAATAPHKCMNILLLWVLVACGTEAAAACGNLVVGKVTG